MNDIDTGVIINYVLLGGAVALVLYAIMIYNNLVRLKHGVSKAWSNIDVLLRQRHDELPKLVETCKQYMDYEKSALVKIMEARSAAQSAREAGDVKGVGKAESAMRLGLGQLFAVAEDYPELKANETFQHLQARISGLEDNIADRREFYNDSVNANNVRIEQFPDVIIARFFKFVEADLLEFSEEETRDVDIKSLFN